MTYNEEDYKINEDIAGIWFTEKTTGEGKLEFFVLEDDNPGVITRDDAIAIVDLLKRKFDL